MGHRDPVSTHARNPEPSGFPYSVSIENGKPRKTTTTASLISLYRVVEVTARRTGGLTNISTILLFFRLRLIKRVCISEEILKVNISLVLADETGVN